jgi:hypothetical protein
MLRRNFACGDREGCGRFGDDLVRQGDELGRIRMIDIAAVKARFDRLAPYLDERARRLFVANEALSAGWGGITAGESHLEERIEIERPQATDRLQVGVAGSRSDSISFPILPLKKRRHRSAEQVHFPNAIALGYHGGF